MDRKFKLGILGAGDAARSHAPHLMAHPEVSPHIRVADKYNVARAEQLARELGGEAYDSLDAMLAAGPLDGLVNCTWTPDHRDTTVAAFEGGVKGVLCERPPALDGPHAEAMVKAAAKAGGKLLISLPYRFMQPPIVRQWAGREELGIPHLADATWVVPGDEPPPGSPDADEGAFARYVTTSLDLAWWLLGCPDPVRVTGSLSHFVGQALRPDIRTEDSAIGTFDFKGLQIRTHAAWGAATGRLGKTETNLWGSKTRLELPLVTEENEPRDRPPKRYRQLYGSRTVELVEWPRPMSLPEGYAAMFDHFVACLTGSAEPLSTPRQIVQLARMISGFYESARLGGRQVDL